MRLLEQKNNQIKDDILKTIYNSVVGDIKYKPYNKEKDTKKDSKPDTKVKDKPNTKV